MLGADPTASDPPARPALQRPAELLAGGRPADAAAALQAVVDGAPTYAAAFVLLGVALDAAGRPAEALSAWHRAAFLVPNSPLVLRERRRLLAVTAAPEPADAERLVEPAPDPVETPSAETPAEDVSVDAAPDAAEAERHEAPDPDPAEPPHTEAAAPERSAEAETPAFDRPRTETLPHGVPTAEMPPADVSGAETWPTGTLEDDAAPIGPDLIQTAPLDDFIFAGTPSVSDTGDGLDPDGLDPDSFDFSAFDLDEDDATDWLSEPAAGLESAAPTTIGLADLGLVDDDPSASFDPPEDLADWAETADASIRLMPPEVPEPTSEPTAPDAETPDEAVFQDMPEAPANPLDAPMSDTLAHDMPPAEAAWAPDPPTSVADELDSLIASLETAPRIRPDPAFSGPAVRTTEADVDAMASETLARIYAAQNQYVRAALVYETLAARDPARADEMLAQAAEMRRRR